MKEKDIKVDYKDHELVVYAEKEDQTYGATVTGSYAAKHYLDDYFYKQKNLDKELRADLAKGRISPVYYYMLMQDMGMGDLAKRVGISRRKLKKHFNPEVFLKLDDKILEKYAIVFGIKLEDLKGLEDKQQAGNPGGG